MVLFRAVAELAEGLAAEGSRLKKRAAIAAAIGAAAAESVEAAGLFALYVAGMPFAESDARRLNAGGALLTKALLAVSGASEVALSVAYRRHGDLGAAAFDLIRTRVPAEGTHPTLSDEAGKDGAPGVVGGLTVAEVAEVFARMAVARTTAARLELVEGLLRRASALEGKYLLKLMLGDMRIGVKQSLVEEAIAVAASEANSGGEKVVVGAVRNAVMLEADLAGAVRRAFEGTLREARMRLFHPLGFMLASPVESPEAAVERFSEAAGKKKGAASRDEAASEAEGEVSEGAVSEGAVIAAFLEDKYDGIRAQVHCGAEGGRVAIYSRSREDVTESFPDLAEAFAAATDEVILDGEILGWDLVEGRALPFSVLGQRIGRKRVSNELRRAVPVVFMAFDLMYAGGELLLELPLRERRNRLEAVVEGLVERVVSPVDGVEVEKVPKGKKAKLVGQAEMFGGTAPDSETVSVAAPKAGVERLMISPSRLVESAEDIDRAYADARARANEGVMLKAAESVYQPGRRGLAWVKLKRELATLDVVVTGAEFGHGRRAGILSDYTFAVRAEDGELLNVGKAYSGLTDVEIGEMSAWMMAHTLDDAGHFRTVEPLMVLEVAFNNVMRSGRHSSGFALRFPRIVRIRTDKSVEEIDTVARVEEVYLSQVDRIAEES